MAVTRCVPALRKHLSLCVRIDVLVGIFPDNPELAVGTFTAIIGLAGKTRFEFIEFLAAFCASLIKTGIVFSPVEIGRALC